MIQDKEWQSLTESERAVVLPLAADEQEFNLLKKMLLVARGEMEEVPVISGTVHEHLQKAMAVRQHKTFRLPKWSYAAAAVLILAAFGLLLLRETGRKKRVITPPAFVQTKTPSSIDSVRKTPEPPSVAISPPPVHPHRQVSKSKTVSSPHLSGHQSVALAAVNTSIAANGHLLDLVAEAY